MSAVQPVENGDGALQPALQRFLDAITRLIEPLHDYELKATAPSRYMQLRDALPGQQNTGGGVARSLPPLWLDAQQLLDEIDTAVSIWQAQPSCVPPTVGRLRVLEAKGWRPQDSKQLEQMADAIEAWAREIDALLHPEPKWHLPNPCPACGTKVVYRKDSAGETVRQPALQIGADGCTCQRCRHNWGPQLFQHLAAVLGYPLPSGVLE